MTVQTMEVVATNGTQPVMTISPKITGEEARRRAKGYLTESVSTGYRAKDPELIMLDSPVWQVLVYYKVPTLSSIRVGFLDVDAITGEVIPFTDEQIVLIRDRASAFVEYNASPTAVPN